MMKKNQMLLGLICLFSLGSYGLQQYHQHQVLEINQWQQILKEEERVREQWQNYCSLRIQNADSYVDFEHSFIFQFYQEQKLEVIMRHLLADLAIHIENLTITRMVHEEMYDLYRVVLEIESISDEDIFHLLKMLNVPNIMELVHLHIARCAQLAIPSSLPSLKELPLSQIPRLVCAQITFVWLNWTHGQGN